MDFQSLKRRDLQFLCKLNNIPANTTNASMADALSSLSIVEGLEELQGNLESGAQGSPERSVQKALKEVTESSKIGTRTRCGTRTRVVEGTDTRKTPATRTTRKRATQEASVQKKTQKDLQADFEADLEQSSVVSENIGLPGGELKDISEEVSGVTVETEGQVLSESQSEAQNEGQQEVIEVDDCENFQEEGKLVHEVQDEEPSEMVNGFKKVDFHSLNRKDLQSLCKKNKIPANTTNAAMADALESLEIVEGLQEFLKDYDSEAPRSPPMSGISSSCARRSRTTQKITKPEPQSSKMITKSCRPSRRRIVEKIEQEENDVAETPSAPSTLRKATKAGSARCEMESIQKNEDSAVHRSGLKKMENLDNAEGEHEVLESSEVSGVAEFRTDFNNSDNALIDVDNFKETGELCKMDENVVEEEVLESLEVTEVFTNTVKVDTSPEADGENLVTALSDSPTDGRALEKLENIHADQSLSLEVNDDSELGNKKLEEGSHIEDVISGKSDPESTTQADDLSDDINVEGETEGSCSEDKMSGSESVTEADSQESNAESESEDSYSEDEISESDSITEADKLSQESNAESESENSYSEDEMSEESDSDSTAQDDQPSLELDAESELERSRLQKPDTVAQDSHAEDQQINVESELENSQLEKPNTTTDSAADMYLVDKTEDGHAENLISDNLDTEFTAQEETPLDKKSLRKLKKILKEKLQESKLATRMENLTLKETEIPLAKVEEDMKEGLVESGNDETLVPQVIPEDKEDDDGVEQKDAAFQDDQRDESSENLATDSGVNIAALCPVDILLDNEVISEDAVTGNINVVSCPPQSTPCKFSSKNQPPLVLTTPTKTPMSGRKNRVVDVNKENIDNSEPGKIKVAVAGSGKILSDVSMGQLKRDFKVLQQQSEKKRQALQARSGNNCLLTSP